MSNKRGGRVGLFAFFQLVALALVACGDDDPAPPRTVAKTQASPAAPPPSEGQQILAALKARPGVVLERGIAERFDRIAEGLRPRFSEAAEGGERRRARVTLPERASEPFRVEDVESGADVKASLLDTIPTTADATDGYVVYPRAHVSGATVMHRALPSGTEDFIAFDSRPAHPEVVYHLALGENVAGLRLVGGSLEMLDSKGAPRLRVAPPYIVGADGETTDAELSVEGCKVDTNPAPPWGRRVKKPEANTCLMRVTWRDMGVAYPAILDPRWTTTGSMAMARQEHTTTLLPNGKVLVAGGRSTSGTTGLNTAELYDPATGLWTSAGTFAGARRLHSATLLGTASTAKVLIAGGIDGSTSSNTAQLYSTSAGWSGAGNLNAPRHGHSATLLANGKVLLAGGLSGTTTLQTAALYTPNSGAGTFAPTTGPIPPPGLRAHTATLIQTTNNQLRDKVLLAGGNTGSATTGAVVLFDPVQSAFSTLQSMPGPREQHTAVALSGGRILLAGGKNGSTTLDTAVMFDPGVGPGSWASAGTMTSRRVGHTATLLPTAVVTTGQVLIAGGSNGTSTLDTAEVFSGTSTWTATALMTNRAQGHTATLLGNHRVLVNGGLNGSNVLTASSLYDPSLGIACTSPTQCVSGNCVDGVCCDTACNGGCGACNLPSSPGICSARGSGAVCRSAAGSCDVAETCNGTSLTCPGNALAPGGTTCRAVAGNCDVAETCSGSSAACPADVVRPSGTSCRASAGNCDVAESCTGSSGVCPTDGFQPTSTICRIPVDNCDAAEFCSGNAASCPVDGFQPATTTCRAAATPCDAAETCTGTSTACPADGQKQNGESCDDGDECTAAICFANACEPGPLDPVCAVTPRVEGVATLDGKKYAVFSYNNRGSDANIARGPQNQLSVAGVPVTNPSTPPPAWFLAGNHVGAFTPSFESASLSWTVGSHTVTASATSPSLPVVTRPEGRGVVIDGTFVTIAPDMTRFRTPPPEPGLAQDPTHGDEHHGVLAGQLTVAPSGAAVYAVPISIPGGMAGMQPVLSLVYNSQSGLGIAGQGFELAGLSTIHRCHRNKASDGFSSALIMDGDPTPSDGYCLDGKRLFRRETSQNFDIYESEQKDFSVITYHRQLNVFTQLTKAGETRFFGSSSASRVRFPSPTGEATGAWLVDRVADQWGNYFRVQYNGGAGDFAARGVRPSMIEYTGHDGPFPTQPFRFIRFGYEDLSARPFTQARHARFREGTIPRDFRLSTIDTGVGRYALAYENDDATLPSRLKSIDYCASGGAPCLEPLFFDWEGGSYSWEPAPGYGLPAAIQAVWDENFFGIGTRRFSGTQFVDLDSDGRLDFVRMRGGQGANVAWRNTGSGWEEKPQTWLPQLGRLMDTDGQPGGGFFADFDGDGTVDFISAPGSLDCECRFAPEINGYCLGVRFCPNSPQATVWLNRIASEQRWIEAPNLGVFPEALGLIDLTNTDFVQDLNGDGRADIIRLDGTHQPKALINLGPDVGWFEDAAYEPTLANEAKDYAFLDLDSDGSADLIHQGTATHSVALNRGSGQVPFKFITTQITGDFLPSMLLGMYPGGDSVDHRLLQKRSLIGDIDGDGRRDGLSVVHSRPGTPDYIRETTVRLSNGLGMSSGDGDPLAVAYRASFEQVVENGTPTDTTFMVFRANMVDLNADGLSDIVAHPPNTGDPHKGVVHFNNGRRWLAKLGQGEFGDHFVPRHPTQGSPETYVDLDGNGVIDLAFGDGTNSGAWLNTFTPPTIRKFGNGLAQKTEVSYMVTTTEQARTSLTYQDDGSLARGTMRLAAPMRVAASVLTDNGIGGMNETKYRYKNLRISTQRRGPQGFESVMVIDPSNIVTLTTYAQAYPYTGMPTSVTRGQAGFETHPRERTLTKTVTEYCDVPTGQICAQPGQPVQAESSRFVYPKRVTDTTFVRTSFPEPNGQFAYAGEITTTTELEYDDLGNPTRSTVNTLGTDGEEYERMIINTYGAPGSREQQMGKPTLTEVGARRINPPPNGSDGAPVRHVTQFEYEDFLGAFALVKTRVEPESPEPGAELHTAYAHDEFGNVTTTTVCASDFENCAPGEPGPADLPFRTTSVSYDPADFNAPVGEVPLVTTLPYRKGRHPVRRTNPAGHVEYTAYDDHSGKLIQHTGPNGLHTCTLYDGLGAITSTSERCGTPDATVTEVKAYRFDSPALALAETVTVTQPPGKSATWVYADALARPIATQTRSFDGDFSETRTEYDVLGRVGRVSNPFFSSEGPSAWTISTYDDIGRLSELDEPLGFIDGTVPPGTSGFVRSKTRTTYHGMAIETERISGGPHQIRRETKNVLGKVSAVTHEGTLITYDYDADGRLTNTHDPEGNVVHLEYDLRGRKKLTLDPDLGLWTYVYNGFGELIEQKDAKGQTTGDVTTMKYDRLGRMTSKTDLDGTSEWIYDIGAGAGIGKLAAMIGPADARLDGDCFHPSTNANLGKRPVRSMHYTIFGELGQVDECVDGDVFGTNYEYDGSGRQLRVHYPAIQNERQVVESHYTIAGYLHYLTDPADDDVFWTALEMNARGQVTKEQTRNGVETVSTRNPDTGWLLGTTSVAHADRDTLIQDYRYRFDEAGNLQKRVRQDRVNAADATEIFQYDRLDRLVDWTVSGSTYNATKTYDYDDLGNLTFKEGRRYDYGICGAGPHAVCSVAGGTPFVYDANGNMTQGDGRTVAYSLSNKPLNIARGNTNVGFMYGADGNRVVQRTVDSSTNATVRTVYAGLGATGASLYERTKRGDVTEHVQYLYAGAAHGGHAFSMRVVMDEGGEIAIGPDGRQVAETTFYHRDHLGSVTAMSDGTGRVLDAALGGRNPGVLGYDPWGARRAPEGPPLPPGSVDDPTGRRGFTGHETIPNVGLINMNGRVYDPVLGRFLSADPLVQFSANLQSYNRYAYVLNNPLRYTDPTGYATWSLGGGGNLLLSLLSIPVCNVNAACYFVWGFAQYGLNYGASLLSGAPWDQALVLGLFQAGTGAAFGALGSGIGGAIFADQLAAALVGGAISGAANAAFSSVVSSDGDSLGQSLLVGASVGALSAGFGYGLKSLNRVSRISLGSCAGCKSDPSAREMDERLTAQTREDALKSGQVTRATAARRIPVIAYGGTEADRLAALDAFGDGVTSGPLADQVRLALERRPAWKGLPGEIKPFEIVLVTGSRLGSQTELGSNLITLDISDPGACPSKGCLGSPYASVSGTGVYTYQRLIVHELGHAAMGQHDYLYSFWGRKLSDMENVNRFENPLMHEQGDYDDRTAYPAPP